MQSSRLIVCALAFVSAAVMAESVGASVGVGSTNVGAGASSNSAGVYGGSNYGATVYTSSSVGTSTGGLQKEAGGSKYALPDEGASLKVQTGHFFLSRWYDLIDIVDFSLGAGPGFLVNGRMTKIAQFGFGYSDSCRVGFRGRSAGIWSEKRFEAGVSVLYYQKVKRERVSGWIENFRSDKMDLDTATVYQNNNDRSFLGIGATIHVLLLVDVNVRPAQAADFVLGWFGIDVLEDDTCKPYRNKDL